MYACAGNGREEDIGSRRRSGEDRREREERGWCKAPAPELRQWSRATAQDVGLHWGGDADLVWMGRPHGGAPPVPWDLHVSTLLPHLLC